MSQTAIIDTTQALRVRIGQAVGGTVRVHVGAPIAAELGQARVSLLAFHIEVNANLRNGEWHASPPALGPAGAPGAVTNALPLDVQYLITVFRDPPDAGEPNELETLGRVMRELHERPNLSGEFMNGQTVRVTPLPYSMEEVSRVWGLFPQDAYRTSVVYLASPVVVEVGPLQNGPPVREHTQRSGVDRGAPSIAGTAL